PDPQDLERDIQLASMGLPSTLNEGTRTSKPFLEGTAKTMPYPKGSFREKDLGGNKPPADMEPIHTSVANPSGIVANFSPLWDELDKESENKEVLASGEDMDEDIQAAEEVRTPSPKQDQPEPSNVQEYTSDSSSPDLKKFDNTLPLTERQLIKYLRKMSRVLFSRITKTQWEQHAKAAVSYADLEASVEAYYDENITHKQH
ncbi:hypothetical protein Tco_0801629, partial [Tanacetum coccineum]